MFHFVYYLRKHLGNLILDWFSNFPQLSFWHLWHRFKLILFWRYEKDFPRVQFKSLQRLISKEILFNSFSPVFHPIDFLHFNWFGFKSWQMNQMWVKLCLKVKPGSQRIAAYSIWTPGILLPNSSILTIFCPHPHHNLILPLSALASPSHFLPLLLQPSALASTKSRQ